MNRLLSIACCGLLCAWSAGAQERAEKEKEKEIPEKNPFDTPADAATGRKYFLGHCASCHGSDGEGGRGINLTTGRYRMGGSDRELFKTISRGIPGSEMPGSRLSDNEVWRLVAYARRLATAGAEEKAPGDATAGKLVYETKGGCVQCHVAGGRGGNLGPELSEIGMRRSLKFLRQSLTDPDAFVADDYKTVTVVTRSGERITGVRLNLDDYSIQLRDTKENLRSFLKRDLKEYTLEKRSLMPPYGTALSATELENLVAYLSSLRGKP
ncbi:MAG: c-type cytochrome [Acidobacteria bacterium]|nr:c-type cytochrome [Acidobacteriota bacterium]